MKPEELLYTKTHEWVHVETDSSGAKIATVGITAFALEALTDLVFIDLPEVGPHGQGREAVRRGRVGQGGERSRTARSTARWSRSTASCRQSGDSSPTTPTAPAGW